MLVYPLMLKTTGEPWCDPDKGVDKAHRKRDYPVVAAILKQMQRTGLHTKKDKSDCTYHQSPGGYTHLTVPVCQFGAMPAAKVEQVKPAVTFVWATPEKAGLSAHVGIGYTAAPVCLGSAKGVKGGDMNNPTLRYDTHLEEAAERAVEEAHTLLKSTCPKRLSRWRTTLIPRQQAVGFLLSLQGRRAANRMPGPARVGQMMLGLMTAGGDGPVSLLALARVYGRVVQDKTAPLAGLYQLRMLAELLEEDYGPNKKAKVAA